MRTRRAALNHRPVTALALVAVLIASCNLADPFASWDGANLIVDRGFSSGAWEIAYTQPPGAANGWAYLSFTRIDEVTAGTTAGLPDAAAPLYRLEQPNLVPNGDFEDVALGATAWTPIGSGASRGLDSSSNAIAGSSLSFSLTADARIAYDLAAGMRDGLVPTARYRFLFDFAVQNTAAGLFDLANEGESPALSLLPTVGRWIVSTRGYPLSEVVHFPGTTALSPEVVLGGITPLSFSIGLVDPAAAGLDNNETGLLDNLRVVRSDVDAYLHLPVTGTAEKPLLPGSYEFAIWMKLETASQLTPQLSNAFSSTGVTLGIDTTTKVFTIAELGLTSSKWTRVSITSQPRLDGTTPQIDLSLAPTDVSAKAPGRILVSSPSLTYLPNG